MKKRGRPRLDRGRERILDAAAGEIERRGELSIQLRDVARDADVSRPTTYRLFPGGRTEVVEATVRRAAERLNRRLLEHVAPCTDPLDLIVEAAVFIMGEMPKDPVLATVMRHGAAAAVLGEAAAGDALELPGRVILARYRELLPHVTAEQLESLAELARRIGLSTLLLGDGDELLRGGEAARAKLRAWLGPLVAEHRLTGA